MEGPGRVNEHMTQNWLRRFNEGDSSLENKSSSERHSAVEDEALLEMIEQASTKTFTVSVELGPS